MTSARAIAGKILSTAGYIFYGVVDKAWKEPWDDAAAKGRMPIKGKLSRLNYEIAEAHNIIDYSYDFLENLNEFPLNKALSKFSPRRTPSIFVYPLFQEIQKEGIIPAHEIKVKKWLFFTGIETVPAEVIKVPFYQTLKLNQVLSKGSSQPAWCAQITIPARPGKKAIEHGSAESREHNVTLTIIGNESLCIEIANMQTADLIALYHELLPHWYDYETPAESGKAEVKFVTEQELNQAFNRMAEEMQKPKL